MKDGLLTKDELESGRIKWLSINQGNGEFESNGKTFPAISGKLLGFDTHTYDYKGKPVEKFDVYILANGEIYNAQFGHRNWMTWRLLNMLMSTVDSWLGNEKIMIRSAKQDDGNYNIAVAINGKYCKWKLKWAEAFKDLDTAQTEVRRDRMIDKWVAILVEKMKFVAPEQNDSSTDDDDTMPSNLSDDIPF